MPRSKWAHPAYMAGPTKPRTVAGLVKGGKLSVPALGRTGRHTHRDRKRPDRVLAARRDGAAIDASTTVTIAFIIGWPSVLPVRPAP